MLNGIFIVLKLKQQSVGKYVPPLGHIIQIPTNQSLSFLLKAAYLAEKQQ